MVTAPDRMLPSGSRSFLAVVHADATDDHASATWLPAFRRDLVQESEEIRHMRVVTASQASA